MNHGIVTKRQGIGNVLMPSALETRFRIDLKIDFTQMLQDLGYTVRYEHVGNGEFSENSLTDDEVAAVMKMALPARVLASDVPPELPKKSFFEFIYNYTEESIAHL